MICISSILAFAALTAGPAPSPVDYLRDVKPILTKRCIACHGALRTKGGLRLDTGKAILKGGDGGPAIEPGDAESSLVVELIKAPTDRRMPPEGEGEALTQVEIDRISGWIASGGQSPSDEPPMADPRRHWSFQPPVQAPIPKVARPGWSENPVDAFLASGHERKGLTPAPEATPSELLRRVSVDLTGLVPTPAELSAFLADTRPDAYERAVEALMASPRHGERWARHWMDTWRYSDWAGFGAEIRESRPHIWRWRDWIVESLNRDKGYDRMVVEMLAGDEVAPDDPDTLRATGYLARSWYKFNRNSWLQNTVDHTFKAFLGLTLACARCHDHKYDPLSQADYYKARAVFEAHDVRTDRIPGQPNTDLDGLTRVYDAGAEKPTYLFRKGDEKKPDTGRAINAAAPSVLAGDLPISAITLPVTAAAPGLRPFVRVEELARAEAAVLAAERAYETVADASRPAAWRALAIAMGDREALRRRIAADDAQLNASADPKAAFFASVLAGQAERRVVGLKADDALDLAEHALASAKADPDRAAARTRLAAAIAGRDKARLAAAKTSAGHTPLSPTYPTTSTGRRLALANWITAKANPLAARVAVNHVWLHHFGAPLVDSVADLGVNGKPPRDQALLDWLAVDLTDHGWSLKRLHRLIVTSRAYRMRSWAPHDDPNLAIDSGNLAFWRMNPRRMEAEIVRDNLLHVAGTLDTTMGGPDLDQATGLVTRRRSIYYRHAAEKQMVFLKIFDSANVAACYRRDETVMPHQALALANSPLGLASARRLGLTISREVGDEPTPDHHAAFVDAAFLRLLGRPPEEAERTACVAYLADQTARLANQSGLTLFPQGTPSDVPAAAEPHLRARQDLVLVLLNHNDFVTVR
ncbi:PSD1 and planctomycete cytochrome C domain-containing protein [Isosphaeraceae bacterium EP7]